MKNRECVSCIKRKTPYCPTSIECMATDDMPYYQNRMMLLKENQELKEQYENAVADYETTMFENEQLNSLVNSCQEEIRQLKKQAEEINKMIEKCGFVNIEQVMLNYCGLLTQQKEFISYLENEIYSIEPKGTGINYNCEYDSEEDYVIAMQDQSRLNTLKEILKKYKRIIGVSDENNIK